MSLDGYRAHGGYAALRRAFELGPEGVLREVRDSARRPGRGGLPHRCEVGGGRTPTRAAPPTWSATPTSPSPARSADRALLEGDPFAVVEAMTVAAYATGCELRVRLHPGRVPGSAPRARARPRRGPSARVPGRRRDGRGLRVRRRGPPRGRRLHLRRGDGHLRVDRGEARASRATSLPSPSTSASSASPPSSTMSRRSSTCSMWCSARDRPSPRSGRRARRGRSCSASRGTSCGAAPTRCLFGVTFAVLELAGGVPGGRALQAVLMGGGRAFLGPTSSTCRSRSRACGRRARHSVPASCSSSTRRSTCRGSDAHRRLLPRRVVRQCVPCRVGTVRQEALARLLSGEPRGGVERELALIGELGQCMRDASICGLGQTASGAVESAIRRLHVFQGEPA